MPHFPRKRLLAFLVLATLPGATHAAHGTLSIDGAITENTCIFDVKNHAHPNEACDHCDSVEDHVTITTQPIGTNKQWVTLVYS